MPAWDIVISDFLIDRLGSGAGIFIRRTRTRAQSLRKAANQMTAEGTRAKIALKAKLRQISVELVRRARIFSA